MLKRICKTCYPKSFNLGVLKTFCEFFTQGILSLGSSIAPALPWLAPQPFCPQVYVYPCIHILWPLPGSVWPGAGIPQLCWPPPFLHPEAPSGEDRLHLILNFSSPDLPSFPLPLHARILLRFQTPCDSLFANDELAGTEEKWQPAHQPSDWKEACFLENENIIW